jgi:heptosyltransferase-2
MKRHQVEYYLSILSALGWETEKKQPRIVISREDQEKAARLLRAGGIMGDQTLLGLCPGAIYGPSKRWPSERFADIGDRAVKTWKAGVILFGSSKEMEICREVSKHMGQSCLNLCGKTGLGEAVAIMQKCHLILTNDSGLMHVAAALGRPLAAIFGSTNPITTGPASRKAVVVRHQTDCAPCLKPECPTDFRCMLDISTDEVWGILNQIKGAYL